MRSKKPHTSAIAIGLSLIATTAMATLLVPAPEEQPQDSSRPLFASSSGAESALAAKRGDPVIVASGEGILVRPTNLPGDQESTEVRLDEDGRIVVPPRHVARFRVNLSVAPVAPVQLVVYQEWTRGDGGHRYDPARLTLFEHSREVESDSATATCILPEGRFNVGLAGPFESSSLTDPPRHAVHYTWEGEGDLVVVGAWYNPEEHGVRCAH